MTNETLAPRVRTGPTTQKTALVVPASGTRRPVRLATLDALRLVAALAVAAYHLTVSWRIDGHRQPEHFLPHVSHVTIYGFLGVELFFLISGFVICMSSWNRSLGDFFTSRVSRLYPAYWVCLLITAAVVTIAPITGGVPVTGSPGLLQIAANLTMLQEPMGIGSVDTVYWTLFVELRFYLLFAALAAFGLTYRRVVLFCAAWMTVAVISPMLGSKAIEVLAIPGYAPYFIAGVAAFLIHRFGRSPLLFGIVGMAWLISLQHVIGRVSDVNPGFPVPTWPGPVIITAAYAALLAIALGWTDRIRWAWLTTAGALTYPFYLLHQRIGYTVIRHTYEATRLPAAVLVPGAMLLTLGLAWLVYRLVEKPLAARMRAGLRQAFADLRAASARDAAPAGEAAPVPGAAPAREARAAAPSTRPRTGVRVIRQVPGRSGER
ncbi:acyltransferase [Actinoplanes oblitus]|uniref:Acyltransferase n=1 Tax=Actinoplanes oblitus TaxID=3040509 RepID=A0ABY8WJ09_9ACTN|nr:acyltransferase [Actinoplanes oblitus]WIM95730.1 acyltransferase [Actinoplanes oblitus]